MESKANYALIGAFVLVATLAAAAFITWLSNAQFDQQFESYEIVFVGPVNGISRGSEVRYNGLRVGEVTALAWDSEDNNTIIATIQVVKSTPIHVDSPAQLEPQGLTGLNYIQIKSGPSGEAFRGRGPYQIMGKMSQLDTFIDSGGSVIESTQMALNRVNATMNEQAILDFHGILSNLNVITKKASTVDIDAGLVERVLKAIEQASLDVSKAALATEAAAVSFDGLVQNDVKVLLARTMQSLNEVDKTLGAMTTLAENGGEFTTDARDAINRLSNSGLTDMEETADGLRSLILSLNEITEKLERNPAEFIAGEKRETMELPQ